MENVKWYVLSVFNTREKKVKESIEKELKLQKLDMYVEEVLIPMEKIFTLKAGKKVQTDKIFLPGYIMVKCSMNGELLRVIKRVDGVISFLGGEKPTPMTDKEVVKLLGKVDELEKTDEIGYESSLIIGQRVNIIDGPFKTWSGIVTNLFPEKKKLSVDVTIFNRKQPLELSYEQVING